MLTELFAIGVGALYVGISICLFLFGANLLVFALRVSRRGPRAKEGDAHHPHARDRLPRVTVQLPIYNELYVSERVIRAASRLDYPRSLLQIQVVDDSTDETRDVVARVVRELAGEGVPVELVRRANRTGYKAGALAHATRFASGEFIAVLDADFVPPEDFVLRTIGAFDDPNVAFVQGRWGHLNRGQSWLTKMQALAIDGHFLVEQSGRGHGGYWFNFNGTAGVWRAEAIADAGGWTADTLTEDLDLSYRAHLRGWTAVYLEDLVVPAELPVQVMSFRRQQHRWARGSIECARRLLPQVWRSGAPWGTKFQATAHLLAYGIHLLLFGLLVIYPAVILTGSRYPGFSTLYGVGYFFALSSIAPAVFFVVGQRQDSRPWVREIPRILLVTVFGSGLMLNTARAALEIFTRPNPAFERTAKLGVVGPSEGERWEHKRYQLAVDRIAVAEIAVAAYAFGTAILALRNGNVGILVFSSVFGLGLLGMAAVTIGHAIASHRARDARRRVVVDEQHRFGELRAEPAS